MQALDTKVLNEGFKNSMLWFKKKYDDPKYLEALQTPCVKTPKDVKYQPTMKTNLPYKDGDFECEFYYENTQPVDILKVPTKGCSVIALLQSTGIWVAGSKFGLSWKVVQLVYKPRKTLEKFGFIGLKSNPTPSFLMEDVKCSSEEEEEGVEETKESEELCEDSDGESDDEAILQLKEVAKVEETKVRRGRKKGV
jgi:hypothetical protein